MDARNVGSGGGVVWVAIDVGPGAVLAKLYGNYAVGQYMLGGD